MRLLRKLIETFWAFSDSSEIAFLKKRVQKLLRSNSDLEVIVHELQSTKECFKIDLEESESARANESAASSRQSALLRGDLETALERNTALQEQIDSLQFSLAEARAQSAIREREKQMLVKLHDFLDARVDAAIAASADSYGHSNQRKRPVLGGEES